MSIVKPVVPARKASPLSLIIRPSPQKAQTSVPVPSSFFLPCRSCQISPGSFPRAPVPKQPVSAHQWSLLSPEVEYGVAALPHRRGQALIWHCCVGTTSRRLALETCSDLVYSLYSLPLLVVALHSLLLQLLRSHKLAPACPLSFIKLSSNAGPRSRFTTPAQTRPSSLPLFACAALRGMD